MLYKNKLFILIFAFLCTLLFSGCTKDVQYSIIPQIQFNSYQVYKGASNIDSITITISYTDGDGDLGLDQQDTIPPYNSKSIYYNNMYVYYYEFINGKFQEVTINDFSTDTIRFKYRFPNLTPKTNNKAIKGDINVTLYPIIPMKSDIIKFRIYIYDRALHQSNIIESPVIDLTP